MIKYDKDYVEKSIKEGKSYAELGREYNVSRTSIVKFAKKSGIELPNRKSGPPAKNLTKEEK